MTLDDLKADTLREGELDPPPVAPDIGHLDIRVGRITECTVHELDDQLYIETVDVGEETPRMASSELVRHYKIEELVDRRVVVICNATILHTRGIERNALLMCASKKLDPENPRCQPILELLSPPTESDIGDFITVEGFPRTPMAVHKHPSLVALLSELTPFEKVLSEMRVNTLGQATFGDLPLGVEGKEGLVTATSLIDCDISLE